MCRSDLAAKCPDYCMQLIFEAGYCFIVQLVLPRLWHVADAVALVGKNQLYSQ